MMGKFSISFSSETDSITYHPWKEAFDIYRPYLESRFLNLTSISKNANIAFIPTIYMDMKGVKERLWFDKKNQTIDFRPLIDAELFTRKDVYSRCNQLLSTLPKVVKKTHLFDLKTAEIENINELLESFTNKIM